MQKSFKRDFGSLEGIFEFIDGFFEDEELERRHILTLHLAAEELFTNMVKYNVGGGSEISISVCRDNERVVLSLTDSDVDEFDVTRVGSASVDLPLAERKRGGLGLHIVRQMVDAMTYEYADRQSRVTVIKSLR